MKRIVIFLLFSFITHTTLAQDTLKLVDSWKDVTSWMVKRIQLTKKLTTALNKNKVIVKDLSFKPENVADSLGFQITSAYIPDSLAIRKIDLTNNQLSKSIEPYIDFLNKNPKIKLKTEMLEVLVQLEATENRLETVARDFNKTAIGMGRRNICFILLGNSIPPEVKFE